MAVKSCSKRESKWQKVVLKEPIDMGAAFSYKRKALLGAFFPTSLLEGFSKLPLRDERDCAGRNSSIQPLGARPRSAVLKSVSGVPFET